MTQVVRIIPKNSLEEVRVELINYRGHDLVGMRVYSDFTKSKEMLPTKKGLTMSVDKLPELIEALQEARRKAEEVGRLYGSDLVQHRGGISPLTHPHKKR